MKNIASKRNKKKRLETLVAIAFVATIICLPSVYLLTNVDYHLEAEDRSTIEFILQECDIKKRTHWTDTLEPRHHKANH